MSSNAEIKNIKFENVTVDYPNGSDVAALAGISDGATIQNVSLNNFSVKGKHVVGGLVATLKSGTIIDQISMTNGLIYSTSTDAGGIAGISSGKVQISNIFSNSSVESVDRNADTGGILGNQSESASATTTGLEMYNILFTGSVKGSTTLSTIGAIYGRIGAGSMNDDFADDMPYKDKNWFYNSENIGLTQSTAKKRGTGKTPIELTTRDTYNTWIDFDDYWIMTEDSYPTLKWLG